MPGCCWGIFVTWNSLYSLHVDHISPVGNKGMERRCRLLAPKSGLKLRFAKREFDISNLPVDDQERSEQ